MQYKICILAKDKRIPPIALEKPNLEVSQKLICMAKVQNFSGISPDLPFTEFDFYELYRQTFATSELGKSGRGCRYVRWQRTLD